MSDWIDILQAGLTRLDLKNTIFGLAVITLFLRSCLLAARLR